MVGNSKEIRIEQHKKAISMKQPRHEVSKSIYCIALDHNEAAGTSTPQTLRYRT